VAIQNKWSEKQGISILRNLIRYKEVQEELSEGNLVKIKSSIVKKIYDLESRKLLSDLYRIKQHDFTSIIDYEQTIIDKLSICNICVGCSREEYKWHLAEIFFIGLGKCTRKEIIKNGLMHDLDGALKYLNNLERTVCSEGARMEARFEGKNYRGKIETKQYSRPYYDKWCSKCRTPTHLTKDCYWGNGKSEKWDQKR
jgi:hypothetical protein